MEQIVQSGAGLLIERVAFDKRSEETDEYGNYVAAWVEQFRTRARYRYLRGREDVTAARLESRKPIVVDIRVSAASKLIDTDWRMRDLRTGEEYQIREITPSQSRAMLELLAESGVAV